MYGWTMDGRTDERIDGQTDGRTDGWMDVKMDRYIGLMDGWMGDC